MLWLRSSYSVIQLPSKRKIHGIRLTAFRALDLHIPGCGGNLIKKASAALLAVFADLYQIFFIQVRYPP